MSNLITQEQVREALKKDSPKEEEPKPTVKKRPWKFYGYFALFLLVLFAFAYGYCNYTIADGGYSGYVRMIHRVGPIRTWEGELDKRKLGGSYNKEDIFEFSVQNDEVAKKVQTAEESGEWVTVHYKEYLISLPWRGKTKIIVYDVTHAEKQPEKPLISP
jgi:hypothetical protein